MKHDAKEIKDLIAFYEKRGWDWVLPVSFICEMIRRDEPGYKKCNFCGR